MRQLDSINPIEAGKEFERYQAERDERDAKLHDRIAALEQELAETKAGTALLREIEQLRADLKAQSERDWTASIIDRLNEFARENAGQFSEVGTGEQAAAMVRDMHGCYNSLRHLNTDLRQHLDQLRKERDGLFVVCAEAIRRYEEVKGISIANGFGDYLPVYADMMG